ncbi:hypothetical protein IQ265_06305 [Nodosilinea sp. LEGE 06152]|uniref:hypothetical protein n=1 Tax=Nodosilinea sp. LEGE 06152 TaxID=2777966 RepID=UPI00187FC454|nr:hypothetical protein [Nodosilinea sp. LEGE 06152]MBE9156441.1 hypothetical protein [Nodosilinea sp. LEGE 06152]
MKPTRIITSGIVAGLALLGVAILPAIAHEYNQKTSTLAQRQPTAPSYEDQAQTAPTEEQMRQMMAQCNSMMSMRHNMMGNENMPEMMEQPKSHSGQDIINPMPR